MRAQEFVQELVHQAGMPADELTKADRYIANAGLRRKAEGRDVPDLSTVEALRIVLGLAAARTPSRAAEDVRDIERFKLMAHGIETREGSASALRDVLGLSLEEIERRDLIDVLAGICEHVAAPWGSALRCLVSVHVELGGWITLRVVHSDFTGELTFIGAVTPHSMDFTRTATIGPRILAWIGHVTKGAE